jgi:prepilin-type N-terminal cleavage/methylation domain-containing protein
MKRHPSTWRHGFTIVELLAVVAIVLVLLALLVPRAVGCP